MEGFRARPGEVLGERYRLVRRLGEGGMGEVWEAVHLVLKRHVAVKILKPRFAQQGEVLLRFRREAQVTAGLGHSKIVEVLDFVWGPGKPTYLVMELLQGQSLESALAQRGCLAWPVALKIAVDVLDALGAAHAAGIVHRDVKPANIWLEGDLNEPRVKVLDFGVAQIADEGGPKLTQTNATVGTPQYLPPEQIAGSRVDARADLWALGVTLFETLAGRPPFVGGDFAALVGAILTQEPPHLRALVPEVPATLANAVAAVLSKSPEQRPASAQAMATPLLELLATVTRKHGDEAFAATMALSSPVVESPGPELPPAAVPALDSSPRLPGTRVHSASSAAAARPAKKRRFSHAMVLNADDALPAQLLAQGPTDAALLELDDDEPPVLPTLSTGRWLLGGLVFALVGAVVLFAILGRQSAPPDSVPGEARAKSMDAGVTGSASRGPAPEPVTPASAGSRDAEAVGSAPPAAPSTESPAEESPRAQDAGSPSTRVLPPQAPMPPESAPAVPAASRHASVVDMAGSPSATHIAPSMSPPPAPAATATRLRRGAIGGTYDRASAQAHVRDAEAAANRCVARARPATGSAQYRVEVPPDGNVMRVTGGDAAVRRCLARAFRMIRWSPPPGGASQYLTLTYEAIP